MNPHARTYDPIRYRRGTRGFAAFVTGLNGLILLGLSLFATPSLGLEQPAASWFVILVGAGGVGHLVAVVGLVRGRAWSGLLVAYLAAAGVAAAAFLALAAATGLAVLGAEPRTAVGFGIWMIGSWLVATRFALEPFTYDRPARFQARQRVAPPVADARPDTGVRKARRSRPLPAPRIIQPIPVRMSLRPISTPSA